MNYLISFELIINFIMFITNSTEGVYDGPRMGRWAKGVYLYFLC